MSFRNRCRIAGADGVIDLSIPIIGGRDQKTLIKGVRISNRQDWQAQHWKTILSCYNRSPWFDYYRDELEDLYKKPFEFLADWNLTCFQWSLDKLKLPVGVSLTAAYKNSYEEETTVDFRNRIRPGGLGPVARGSKPVARGFKPDVPGDPLSGKTGDLPTIGEEGKPSPRYRQVFEERTGFIPHLSILDLLFCEGKNAIRYI